MKPKIVIDGVFFQIGRSGIARVWMKLLEIWAREGRGEHFVVVDRNRSCPRVPGITYRDAPPFMHNNEAGDARTLQAICDEVGADLFISTYYTITSRTPSAMLVYDMIPEVMGYDLQEPMWQQKQRALQHASAFAAISESTARDLRRHLDRPDLPVHIAYPGSDFRAPDDQAVAAFKARHGIDRPYFLISGSRSDYKNVKLFFQAFETLGDERGRYAIVCTGGGELEAEFKAQAGTADLKVVLLDDTAMQCAYRGAVALVYPSLYEGFGLPVLEAMACDCPVIATRASSVPEVGGPAALYLEPSGDMLAQMQTLLHRVQEPAERDRLIALGRTQAARFTWADMADRMREFLFSQALEHRRPATGSPCRLCGHDTEAAFRLKVLHRHDVGYERCPHCGATQTEPPYWLDEAYAPINEQFDTGQVTRSLINAGVLRSLIKIAGLPPDARVVDYGCGSGLLVRTLRDTGVDAWGYDRYSSPRLALAFQTPNIQGFDVINLCEVVEHFDQPREVFDALFASDPRMVVIQTGVSPRVDPDWDYLTPEHGQHIFLMAPRTIGWLCQTYGRRALLVSGFVVLLTPEIHDRIMDPATGQLRTEHQREVQNLLPQLWHELFKHPYRHAGLDQQRLKSSLQPA